MADPTQNQAPAPRPRKTPRKRAPFFGRVTKRDQRGLTYIIAGAVALHIFFAFLLFMPVDKLMPRRAKTLPPVPQDFFPKAYSYADEVTGEQVIEREYTVSTKLFTPEDLPAEEKEATPPEQEVDKSQEPAPVKEPVDQTPQAE